MLPRFRADYRVLLWASAMPVVVGFQYLRPELIPYLFPLGCYLAVTAGIFAHNHNHCPTFSSKRANTLFGHFLSLFYGYPTFAWVPTHNLNHHKLTNRAGDATITWRYTNRHNWLVASTYFFVSSYFQSEPIKAYIRRAKEKNPRLYRSIVLQYVVWAGTFAGLLGMSLWVHGFPKGLWVWTFASGIPAFFALWTIMLFNYIQHVHTDPWSPHNHSRNFTGKLLNFFLFNNGYHGVHHEQPGAHWSVLPGHFAKVKDKIHPELQHKNFAWFLLATYVLAPLWPRLGTRQIGRAPFDTKEPVDLTTDEVDAAEPGTNAAMV